MKGAERYNEGKTDNKGQVIESEIGVVAADDARCSAVGVSMLRLGGHAVDAAVAAALCVGVVFQASSGIGGGSFMVVKSSSGSIAQAFDMRETAPIAASQVWELRLTVSTKSLKWMKLVIEIYENATYVCLNVWLSKQNMYQSNPEAKFLGALSVGVPGELAGLHAAWLKHGRLPWKTLFQPAIELAKNGFVVSATLSNYIASSKIKIMSDPGLRNIYAPNGILIKEGEICSNVELGQTLEIVAEEGIHAFYNGTIGEKLVKDVREVGGILTMEDLRNYKVEITDAMVVNVMGYTIYGMPPPSSGTLGLSLVCIFISLSWV